MSPVIMAPFIIAPFDMSDGITPDWTVCHGEGLDTVAGAVIGMLAAVPM